MNASKTRTFLALFLSVVACSSSGCFHPQARLQSDDDEVSDRDKDLGIKTIGDVSVVANAEPIQVSGVGLVTGLDGTGGFPPPGGYRAILEDYLRKRGVENVKEILASPHCALVLVTAIVPAGCRKDDPIDVEVVLPPQTKASSLRGGYLTRTLLYNYDTAKRLNPNYNGPDRPFKGHPIAEAEGPILVGFGDGDEAARLKQGRIWGGGKTKIDRPFYLAVNQDKPPVSIAVRIAERVNETMYGPNRGPLPELASPKSNQVVLLNVPPQYRLNLPRYLRVVRLIPFNGPPAPGSVYRRRLERDLADPQHTVTAALRLEALGSNAIEPLKRGLKHEHALVRFSSAEALAYLGCSACGEELANLVDAQPSLRSYCLTAMASLDESVCHVKLRELLSSPSPETRYGAFRALRALDEHDPAIRGELLNDSFWLHRVAPGSPSLVHVSRSRRAEIVLFGEQVELSPPFSFLAGEFTVTAERGATRCTISRLSLKRGAKRQQCSLDLEDLVRALADLGATYSEVDEVLAQAKKCETLSCAMEVDALPQATSVFELAENGANDLDFQDADARVFQRTVDLGATPNLFEKNASRKPKFRREDDGRSAHSDH